MISAIKVKRERKKHMCEEGVRLDLVNCRVDLNTDASSCGPPLPSWATAGAARAFSACSKWLPYTIIPNPNEHVGSPCLYFTVRISTVKNVMSGKLSILIAKANRQSPYIPRVYSSRHIEREF